MSSTLIIQILFNNGTQVKSDAPIDYPIFFTSTKFNPIYDIVYFRLGGTRNEKI